jgi:hypothetical protein
MEIDELNIQSVDRSNALDNILSLAVYSSILNLLSQIVLPVFVMSFTEEL